MKIKNELKMHLHTLFDWMWPYHHCTALCSHSCHVPPPDPPAVCAPGSCCDTSHDDPNCADSTAATTRAHVSLAAPVDSRQTEQARAVVVVGGGGGDGVVVVGVVRAWR